ncbi:hypothetical protein B0H21DRAFT_242952 [Amylocystis lapponica]|nr:hypothetical protein B0H21DRAFT_242952 [Amylocystis lapponica]
MTNSVTISLLPVTLSLVHLPRSRLDTLAQHVLRQILIPNPTFLNLTCNEIELSLFAECHALHDFRKIARRDARKLKTRRKGRRTESPRDEEFISRAKRLNQDWEPVEVSSDTWSVLQIDSHSDQLDNSGARVHELSAPLAAAGISILYQSSYMSDFIFVKSFRLTEVMSLLASAGFDLYSSDLHHLSAQLSTFPSPFLSPTDDTSSTHVLDLSSLKLSGRGTALTSIAPEGGAVFTRSRSNTDTTSSSSGSRNAPSLLHMSNPHDFDIGSSRVPADLEDDPNTPAPPAKPTMIRSQSHSPSGCEVHVLPPDLTYVGLSDDSAEMWTLKIVKLVAFPDTIAGLRSASASIASIHRPSFSLPSADMTGSGTEPSIVSLTSSPDVVDSGLVQIVSVSDGEAGSGSDTTTRVGPESPKEEPFPESPLFDSAQDEDLGDDFDEDEGDGYFSASSPGSSPLQLPDREEETRVDSQMGERRPLLSLLETSQLVNSTACRRSRSSSVSSSSSAAALSPLVPFFSFTRSSEGSSLTAPVSLLAALFPPNERHMVICSDELDVSDSRAASPLDSHGDEEPEQDDDDEQGIQGPLKCLQIDLRKFGLDKHGLVNRFSRTLEENGINHMYSSTYKTANLLVDKAHASRAQALLRSC